MKFTLPAMSFHLVFSHAFLLFFSLLPEGSKILPPAWSLDIEMQFYLVAPILIAIIQRTKTVSLGRIALYGFSLGGLAVFVANYGSDRAQQGFLAMYLVFFLIGLHAAHYRWEPTARTATLGLSTAVLLAGICIALPGTRPLLIEGSHYDPRISRYNTDANILVALLVAPYSIKTTFKRCHKPNWLWRQDRDLSNVTYEVYLFHWTALWVVYHFGAKLHLSRYTELPGIALAWLFVFSFSSIIYKKLDRPIDKLRTQYVRSKASSSAMRVLATDDRAATK